MLKNIKEIVTIILVVISLACCFVLFNAKKAALATRLATEERLFKEKVAKKQADETLLRTESERDGVKGHLNTITEEAQSLESELVKEKNDIESVKGDITNLNNETITIEEKLKQYLANITELEGRIKNLFNDSLKLSEETGLLQKTTEALKARLAQLANKNASSASLTGTNADNQALAANIPTLQGEILTVNREFDFIVISLGKNNGIEEGMIFDVARDNKKIGQVKIETVRDRISAAALIDKETIIQMRPGDKVYSSDAGQG